MEYFYFKWTTFVTHAKRGDPQNLRCQFSKSGVQPGPRLCPAVSATNFYAFPCRCWVHITVVPPCFFLLSGCRSGHQALARNLHIPGEVVDTDFLNCSSSAPSHGPTCWGDLRQHSSHGHRPLQHDKVTIQGEVCWLLISLRRFECRNFTQNLEFFLCHYCYYYFFLSKAFKHF